jgi:hypothetical protein
MSGNYNKSMTIACEKYGYESPENPGTLPRGVVINNEKYILLTKSYGGVCDSDGCQKQYTELCIDNPATDDAYANAPLYSKWGHGELCVVCAGVGLVDEFVPSEKEVSDLLTALEDESSTTTRSNDESDAKSESDESESEDSQVNDMRASFVRL